MLIFTAILYGVWGVVIAAYQARQIVINKTIKLINFANLMYSFVYGLLPLIVLIQATQGALTRSIDTSSQGIWKLIVVLGMSVFVHFWMNFAYRGTKIKKSIPVTSERTTFRAGWIMLIIGFASLFLWTRAAGGIMEFIKIAPGIRGGYVKIKNPWAFLQNVARILMLAACIMVSYWLQHKRKIWVIIPAAAALYGAFLFIMAWDSRAAFGFVLMMIALVYLEYLAQSGKMNIKKVVLFVAILAVATIIVMVQSEAFAQEFRGNAYEEESSSNLFVIIEKEFGFIVRVQQRALETLTDPSYKLQIINDLINAITAWIPSRFIPFDLPKTLWNFNTVDLMGGTTYAIIPTDFVSACILDLGVSGLLLVPLAMGWLLKKVDGLLQTENYNFYRSVVKAALATVVINKVSHFQFSGIPTSIFYIVLGHFVVIACRTLENGGKWSIQKGERLS